MDIKIRTATEKDFPTIISMIKEFAAYLGKAEKVKVTLEDMKKENACFQCLIAEDSANKPIGYAFYSYLFHTWSGKTIYLEDLFVKEKYRGNSVGTILITALIDTAKRNNCNGLQWHVLDWNEKAINFYRKIGATVGDDKLNCYLHINR